MPPDTVPIPVTVVAGTGRSALRRLLAALLAGRPQAARWAVLDNTAAAEADGPMTAGPGVERFAVPGGCACCLAGPAFRTALVRLLRAGPWQRLLVVVDPSGHAHAIVDQLRSPPFDRLLRVSRLLVSLAGTGGRAGPDDADRLALAPSTVAFASDFLLPGDDADGSTLAAHVEALERADPWPRRRVAGEDHRRSTSKAPTTGAEGGVGQTGVVSPDGAVLAVGWHVLSALSPAALAGERLLVRHWPGEAVVPRRPMLDVLESLGAAPEVTGLVALVRTSRAWYRWACGRVAGPGPLAIDQADFTEAETAWRLDSRLVVSLATGADRGRLASRLEPLAGLFDGT